MPSYGSPIQQSPEVSNKSAVNQHHLAPFTVKELRDAIPSHCFERSLLKSSSYIVMDLTGISILLCIGYYFDSHYSEKTSWLVSIVFWNVLWFVQGAIMFGIWIIAHECGHQAFSKWKSVNDLVGWVLHSALLVPYHSWRITHGIHHKSTSHMDRDQAFVPKTYKHVLDNSNASIFVRAADSPFVALIQIIAVFLIGWPFYIIMNAWGQNYGRRASHFEPSAPMFKASQKSDVLLSVLGIALVISGLTWFSITYSLVSMLKFYFVPYLYVNFWLVLITYLQHTDARVPHFRGEEWSFIRGALCTVDRDYGIFNILHHHIGDTHVAHHLFSQLPHYHAQEATAALKKVLGKYYLEDKTPIMLAIWKSWNTCHYVDDDADVVYYQKFESSKKK